MIGPAKRSTDKQTERDQPDTVRLRLLPALAAARTRASLLTLTCVDQLTLARVLLLETRDLGFERFDFVRCIDNEGNQQREAITSHEGGRATEATLDGPLERRSDWSVRILSDLRTRAALA